MSGNYVAQQLRECWEVEECPKCGNKVLKIRLAAEEATVNMASDEVFFEPESGPEVERVWCKCGWFDEAK